MSKTVAEDCRAISIFKIKEWGYFERGGYRAGSINWTSSCGDKNNISFVISLVDKYNKYIELDYRIRNHWGDGEWKDIKQKYPIVSSLCNYGGKRYWFECSVFNHGRYCGRRVGKLYLGAGSSFFACRHCYDLIYRSSLDGYAYTFPDLDEYEKKISRWSYNGRPTKKHIRYMKMQKQVLNDWNGFMFRMEKRANNLKK